VDEVIVLSKGRIIFKQYTPKRHKCLGIKIYKLGDMTSYTNKINVYLRDDSYT